MKLLGDRGAPDHIQAFQHADTQPRAGQVIRTYEPVVTGADNHGIETLAHRNLVT